MKAAVSFIVLPLVGVTLASCGGGGFMNPNPISVSISPASAQVPAGQSAQFSATVSNTTNTGVNWSLSGSGCQGSACGALSSTSGSPVTYTAPASLPNPPSVTLTAMSQAFSQATASATITLVQPTGVAVSPSVVSVPAAATQPFSASINGTPTPASQFTWEVDGAAGGDSTHGTISASGLYTAPLTPPPGGSVTITAVSQSNGSGNATATIVFSNASLQGAYAFAFSGNDSNGFLSVAGSFQADGNGNITSGMEDINEFSGVFTNVSTLGTYSVGADGRGTIVLNNNPITGTSTLRFALQSNLHALIIEFDSFTNGFFVTGSGTMDSQDVTAFSNAAITGPYSFNFAGIDSAGSPLGFVGEFAADGNGNLSSGVEDLNDAGTVFSALTLTGSYSVAANGRGTTQLSSSAGTFNFAFYVVNATDMKFVEIDTAPIVAGEVLTQQGGPGFSDATLKGNYAFTLGGASSVGPFGAGGIFTADGSGNLTGGVEDINNNGAVSANLTVSGTYSIGSNGRGIMTLTASGNTFTFAFYPATTGLVNLLETDTSFVNNGSAEFQQSATFSNSTLAGSYAANFTGATSNGEEDMAGQISGNGSGIFTGTVDLNNVGSLASSNPLVSSTYSLASNGRGTATLHIQTGPTTFNMTFYAVSPSSAFFLEVDGARVMLGQIARQF